MAMEFDLIRPGTKLTANGEGEAHERDWRNQPRIGVFFVAAGN